MCCQPGHPVAPAGDSRLHGHPVPLLDAVHPSTHPHNVSTEEEVWDQHAVQGGKPLAKRDLMQHFAGPSVVVAAVCDQWLLCIDMQLRSRQKGVLHPGPRLCVMLPACACVHTLTGQRDLGFTCSPRHAACTSHLPDGTCLAKAVIRMVQDAHVYMQQARLR